MPKKSQTKINDIQQQINETVAKHLEIANKEMGAVQTDIAEIKTHIEWIKNVYGDWEKRWDKLDNRIWMILATIVIGFLANIYFK